MTEIMSAAGTRRRLGPSTSSGTPEADLAALHAAAVEIVGAARVCDDRTTARLHSYDASMEHGRPDLVVAPTDRVQLRALVAAATRHGVPYLARGAGTGYSGGALPARGGMVILTAGLDRILEVDVDEGWIRCEPGVVLATVHRLARDAGWLYPPDPSSHQVCTIGGTVAENAGGPHALGAGPTSHHVAAIDLVLPDGRVRTVHDQQAWDGGLDLRSLVIGSEGTLGIVESVTLRLVRGPGTERVVLASFDRQEDALGALTDVLAAGTVPSALDMLTGGFLPRRPDFADPSLLFVGLQGEPEEVAEQVRRVQSRTRAHRGRVEVLEVSAFLERRAILVREKVRRMVAASGAPRYYLFDAVAPRSRLADLMDVICRAATRFDLPVLNTFHAGDGNVHPTPFYDPDDPGHAGRLREFSTTVLRECRAFGGALSGEHGVGSEKRDLMPEFFAPRTLAVMHGVKSAFDPTGLCNPATTLPDVDAPRPTRCAAEAVRPPSGPPVAHVVDMLVEVTDARTTFADIEAVLAGSPYELPYEPLGRTPDARVLSAVEDAAPGLRTDGVPRERDLVLGAVLSGPAGMTEVGGRVAKDVGGYELRKLVYGGRGRLGTLDAVRLRLTPRPGDSRVFRSAPLSAADAVALCRVVYCAHLPTAYLGVLLGGNGEVVVTGRLETRGGSLGRQVDRLTALAPSARWTVDRGTDCWSDPVMRSLGPGTLAGSASPPWGDVDQLRLMGGQGAPAFASAGHRRTWWVGPLPDTSSSDELLAATIAAFGGCGT